jgi:hypothetical protein
MLSSLLRRALAQKGIDLSIVKILSTLSGIKEVAIIHRGAHSRTGPVVSYSKLNLLQKRLVHALDLDRFSAV